MLRLASSLLMTIQTPFTIVITCSALILNSSLCVLGKLLEFPYIQPAQKTPPPLLLSNTDPISVKFLYRFCTHSCASPDCYSILIGLGNSVLPYILSLSPSHMTVVRNVMIFGPLAGSATTSGPDGAPPGRAWPALETLSAPSSASTVKQPARSVSWHT